MCLYLVFLHVTNMFFVHRMSVSNRNLYDEGRYSQPIHTEPDSVKPRANPKMMQMERQASVLSSFIESVKTEGSMSRIDTQHDVRNRMHRTESLRVVDYAEKAAIKIQSFVRMMICKNDYLLQKELAEEDDFDER